MPQQIIIAEKMRIAALINDEKVEELIVAKGRYQIGDVYLGTVENVLPGIDAAFVNIGESEKNGFIHVSDLGPLRLKTTAAGITELLEPRQEVLVQVIKEPTGNKGARLTGNLSLPGRYLVLQPHGQGVNISRKINIESERNRLRAIGVLIKPPGTGLLIRTEADSINEELLIADLENLIKQWEGIQISADNCSAPNLLNRDEDFIKRILRDHLNPEISKVVVENNQAVERAQEFLNHYGSNVLVEIHHGQTDLFQHYKINLAIHNALQPRVDLPSGGYIIIEPTEALTVIDVNSGSFTRSSNARETVLWTNCEAAKEIAKQLKLRNIGGVIIIDFIDMDSRKDQLQLLEHFASSIKNDSARPQIAQLTELGLLELTRKREGQNIYELFGKPCPNCFGLGHLPSIPNKEQIEEVKVVVNKGDLIEEGGEKNSANLVASNEETSQQVNPASSNDNNYPTQRTDQSNYEDASSEGSFNKQKIEIMTVSINNEEEEIFRDLGINPSVLLDKNINKENIFVHIVRPEEDPKEVLNNAKQSSNINSSKIKKKGKYASKISNKNSSDNQLVEENEFNIKTKEIEEENNNLNVENSLTHKNELTTGDERAEKIAPDEIEDPRRKRRRSSASS
tara:strand:- start:2618 stop:4492 length:1875 start_codon:yes stop_codon:yes gene_type:complete